MRAWLRDHLVSTVIMGLLGTGLIALYTIVFEDGFAVKKVVFFAVFAIFLELLLFPRDPLITLGSGDERE